MICDICLKPIVEGETYQSSLSGDVVHIDCLDTVDDEEEDERGESRDS